MKILIFSILCTQFSVAFAARFPLVKLTSQSKPELTAYIGAVTDSKNKLNGIFYRTTDGNDTDFSTSDLQYKKVLIREKNHDVAYIQLNKYETPTAQSISIFISYPKSVIDSTAGYGYLKFKINYNQHINAYEAIDESGRKFTGAYATTHRNYLGMAVGIDAIKLQ